ncbi:TetR family transcriptional regulator [Streptomyces eurocidicus]|uniref:AcrR family transcriptional regulator n=1 Tax=Streptomyces eurocidicus TaxID=66423 RepID=A0A2N8NTP6_STREU|nr:TetR/AcrR family transcriptional regulator [Streptomyces eurocidicus]MBB5119404.1 AcrR family transcriptional regulator [Streptomyces eurocidicus]MBF6053017.1 TetR family transcriptional regulator [Streptomyces eurocidicus]PNE32149.1 TetR family transcriptional regulator [Streptomyces eurocidicus]
MTARRRLSPDERREELLDAGARLFAAKPYEEVLMEDVAERAGISRALLYRYFPGKRDLFAAIYRQAADRLLARTAFDASAPLAEQLAAGLDTHIDYFAANKHTVLAANRELAGDQVIQTIISDELAVLRGRVLDATGLGEGPGELVSAVLMSWLVFVRTLTVDWLANGTCSRAELRDVCVGALLGALAPVLGPGGERAPAPAAAQVVEPDPRPAGAAGR